MTNRDQTFVKQRFEEEGQNIENDENDISAQPPFVDLQEFRARTGPLSGPESQSQLTCDRGTFQLNSEVEEQLRARIRELEETVSRQNLQILDGERIKRNYDAGLVKLSSLAQENDLLEKDREKFFKESQFYQRQAEDKTKECEKLSERNIEQGRKVIEQAVKIQTLERQVMDYEDRERMLPDNRVHLDTNLTIECLKSGLDEPLPTGKRRRREFRKSVTSLPKCANCQTVFDRLQPHKVECRFHRAYPQPLKVWKQQLGMNDEKPTSMDPKALFWPCCEKIGVKEPPGCLTLKCHDIVYPGEE